MSKEILKEKSKCPFTGVGTPPKHSTGKGTSNRDWWPNNLNLKILTIIYLKNLIKILTI